MSDLPFCVFKRKRSKYYYVKFKDFKGKYLPALSTKQLDKSLAIEVSFEWLREGKPLPGRCTVYSCRMAPGWHSHWQAQRNEAFKRGCKL